MAEMAIELQIERIRVAEITKARDATLQQLSEAYSSIHEKNTVIERMQLKCSSSSEDDSSRCANIEARDSKPEALKAHIDSLEKSNAALRARVEQLEKGSAINSVKALDLPPLYEAGRPKVSILFRISDLLTTSIVISDNID